MRQYNPALIFLASFSAAFILLTTFAIVLVDLVTAPARPTNRPWFWFLLAPGFVTISHVGILFGASTLLTKGSDVRVAGRLGLLVAVVDWGIIVTLLAGVMAIEKLGHGGLWELLAIFLIVLLVGPVLALVLVVAISQRGGTK
jgi:hypothetical protein